MPADPPKKTKQRKERRVKQYKEKKGHKNKVEKNKTEQKIVKESQPKEKKTKPVEAPKIKKLKGVETREGAIYIKTTADEIYSMIRDGDKSINELSRSLDVDASKIEEMGLDMQEQGLVEVIYPTNLLANPRIKAKKVMPDQKFVFSSGKEIKRYNVISDKVPTIIRIKDVGKNVPVYEVIPPLVGYGTEAIMNQLIIKISEEVDVTSEELIDPKMMSLLKDKFLKKAIEKVDKKFPQIDNNSKEIISGIIVHKMYGLKDIELLMNDDFLEEISINSAEYPIAVYHKEVGWCMTNMKMSDEDETLNFASSIGRKVGKTISIMHPLLDAHLITGDRVQATLFPISSSGNTITIRKFSRNPWTIVQYIKNGTMNSEIGALLWLSVQYELSVIIAGGTASGKTSCLNSIAALIQPNQRVISIEDVREISLPESIHWNWVPLTARESRSEGAGNISMLDLMVTSLRMRPDRMIVGEVRKKKQAETLFEAIHTGHSVYTTLHADSAEQAYIRLIEEPLSIPKAQLEGVHLIVIMFRDRRKGFRKIIQIAEVMPVAGDLGERDIKLNLLYRWSPKEDKWERLDESERVINEIATHTGMSEDEINDDLKEKEMILDWMVKRDIMDINNFGKIMDVYYRNPELIIKYAKQNKSPEGLF